ncbi:MAG: aminopeptidase P family protein [Armatimonadetes bacterium]|nr:aminopeptidase P family protein [Armatimonadota bacterium]
MRPSFTERRSRLQTLLRSRDLPGALLTDSSTITYLFGVMSIIHTPAHPPNIVAVVPARGDLLLLVPESEQTLAGRLPEPPEVAVFRNPGERARLIVDAVRGRCGGSTLGIEKHRMPVTFWEGLTASLASGPQLVDVSSPVEILRARKDPWEVAQIEKAARVARHAFDVAAGQLNGSGARDAGDDAAQAEHSKGSPGQSVTPTGHGPGAGTELAIKSHMEHQAGMRAAATCSGDIVAVHCNVLCRPDLDALHGLAQATPIPEHGVGYVLSTIRVAGYWADVAGTVFRGRVADDPRQALEVAAQAQRRAMEAVAPGVMLKDVVARMDAAVGASPFAGMRRFSAVRGLGLEKSEYPRETDGAAELNSGHVFCLQCYIVGAGYAVGQSDTVLVTESGYRCLTTRRD